MSTTPVLYTVPHTGTNFVAKFLDEIGLDPGNDFWRIHAYRIPDDEVSAGQLMMEQKVLDADKAIVTARDPYLSAIRYFHQSSRANLIHLNWSWGRFFNVINSRDYYLVDIGCRKEDRLEMMNGLLSYLGYECDADIVEKFVSEWKPENSSDSKAKQDYLENGTLPALNASETWDLLSDAVEWYKDLPLNDFEGL